MTNRDQNMYQAYLLRCWPVSDYQPNQPPQWRFIVETISEPSQRRGFESIETLVTFLRAEFLDEEADGEGPTS